MLSRATTSEIITALENAVQDNRIRYGLKKTNAALYNYPEQVLYLIVIGEFSDDDASKMAASRR